MGRVRYHLYNFPCTLSYLFLDTGLGEVGVRLRTSLRRYRSPVPILTQVRADPVVVTSLVFPSTHGSTGPMTVDLWSTS